MNSERGRRRTFPIVALGASAGGVEALRSFFEAVPDEPGIAFVVVTHLDPQHESHLAPILARATSMDVISVEDGMRVKANCVYVRPPGGGLSMDDGVLHLLSIDSPEARNHPIDRFFQSLAEECGEHAICVVLSGAGSDGTVGLRAIKEHDGLAIAQKDGDSAYAGMRRSAVATGLVDFILEPGEMPGRIIDYLRRMRRLAQAQIEQKLTDGAESTLDRILERLRQCTGYDLRQYKKSTVLRRIRRRMQVTGTDDPDAYLKKLDDGEAEAEHLFRDLLIGVTQFFRVPDTFDVLAREVVPALCNDRGQETHIRVWVPGCSTGEEVYSLAMLFAEDPRCGPGGFRVRIFGTDIDEAALATARAGAYTKAITADVPGERLNAHFRLEDDRYVVRPRLRDMCVFATHDLVQDPPFSRMDLISCRNVFIYFEAALQRRMFPLLHFALLPRGYLVLGKSETAQGFEQLFAPVDKAQRIFQRKEPALRPKLDFPQGSRRAQSPDEIRRDRHVESVRRLAERYLLENHTPPSVVVDAQFQCVFFAGNTGVFLHPPSGAPNLNVFDMVKPDMRGKLQSALHQAARSGRTAKQNLPASWHASGQPLRLIVRPLGGQDEHGRNGHFLITIEKISDEERAPARGIAGRNETPVGAQEQTVEHLEEELESARLQLRTATEDLEVNNAELQSSNEELLSSNEELQSTVEELETSKEELQSVNEELDTVNHELSDRVDELGRANDDLQNLHASTDLPVVFLDRKLRVQMFTPAATALFHLISRDIGRSIHDIAGRHDYTEFRSDLQRVLEADETVERQVTSEDGWIYKARVFPYRTTEGEPQGAVATFLDITEVSRMYQDAENRAAQQAAVASTGLFAIDEPDSRKVMQRAAALVIQTLGVDFCVVLEFQSHEQRLVVRALEGPGCHGSDLSASKFAESSQAHFTLEKRVPVIVQDLATDTRFERDDFKLQLGIVSGMSVLVEAEGKPFGVLKVHSCERRKFSQRDVDFLQSMANVLGLAVRRSTSEAQLIERRHAHDVTVEKLRRAEQLASLGTLSAGIAHEINNPLNSIWMTAELAKHGAAKHEDEKLEALLDRIIADCQRCATVTRGVLSFARPGEDLSRTQVDVNRTVNSLTALMDATLAAHSARLEVELGEDLPPVTMNAIELERVLVNLVQNAAEIGASSIRVSTESAVGNSGIVLRVRDNGPGIPEENLNRVFDPFFSTRRAEGGTGLGLSLVHRFVNDLGGTVSVANQPSGGAEFVIELPLTGGESQTADGA
ncbi:MAG: chemotaxis protein CheB [Gammaproteobacteria bacterium]